jgi:hypothetical protein
VHTTAHKQGFHTLTKATDANFITMGNGMAKKASLVGKITGTMCDKSGVELGMATLTNVVHLPTGSFNLFSLTKITQAAGWILGRDTKEIWLTKDGHPMSFDIAISTPKGVLFAMYIWQDTEVAGATTDKRQTMTIQQDHDRLAHSGEENTRKTANELVWRITRGSLKPCDACSTGKAKQKKVPKVSDHKVANVNVVQRMHRPSTNPTGG